MDLSRTGASVQVGNAFEKVKTDRELKLIASDPKKNHTFKVTNYTALDGLLSKLQQSIIHMEGEGSHGLCESPLPQHSAGHPPPDQLPLTLTTSLKWQWHLQSSSPP